jgi:hypothetical protein
MIPFRILLSLPALLWVLALPSVDAIAASREAQVTPGAILINEVLASNATGLTDPQGEYDDWIELYNAGTVPLDVAGLYLTDDPDNPTQWQIPENGPAQTTLAPGGFLLIWADEDEGDSGLHTNFKLSATGETLALFAADGTTLIDRVSLDQQDPDVAYGRYPDGQDSWNVPGEPTPGSTNRDIYLGLVADTKFSVDRGFYDQPFYLTISSATEGAEVYYTLDASQPAVDSRSAISTRLYTEPILIDKTTCVRAMATKPGWKTTNIDTHTYVFLADVLRQPQRPAGFPSSWKSVPADYAMDPSIVESGEYRDQLLDAPHSLPSMSLVMNQEDLFGEQGIYANSSARGVSWERPGSIEWIDPNDGDGFQVNCGVRIQGGYFRSMNAGRKKSFRLLFKGIYGSTKLYHPLMGPDAAQAFDTLTLRAGANDGYTWNSARDTEQFLRDEFARQLQLATGQAAARGLFVHLYVNGLYWGLYNPVERPDGAFSASYYGGDKEDWDVFSHKGFAVNQGDRIALNQMREACREAAHSFSAFQQLQGRGPDGAADPDLPHLMDVHNYIDYLIVNYWGGNWDWPWNNYWLARDRTAASTGFKFYCWDTEDIMLSPRSPLNMNKVANPDTRDVGEFHGYLRQNPEYRLEFADRIHRLFFDEGPLTASQLTVRYAGLAATVEKAIIAESARWGDQHYQPPQTQADWLAMRDRLLQDYLPKRSDIVLQQFRQADLYPDLAAPVFEVDGVPQSSGEIPTGSRLAMIVPQGDVWYTEDGTDPRIPGSGAGAEVTEEPLVREDAPKNVWVPTAEPGDDWYALEFDDSQWRVGTGGVGYEIGNGYRDLFGIDVESDMFQNQTSCLIRIPFTLDQDLSLMDRLTLYLRYDDGFVAYLNGVEVARANAPQDPAWHAQATGQNSDSAAQMWEPFAITQHRDLLRQGANLLAIHGLNANATSSDFLISAELMAADALSPADDTGLSSVAQRYTGPLVMATSTHLRARALRSGTWSALQEATYSVGPLTASLRITEIMYHPEDQGAPDAEDAEFVELGNIGTEPIDLNRVQFTAGIAFVFPPVILDPGGYLVVVRNREAFARRYGMGITVAGEYTGRLDNGGERLRLEDASGGLIQEFRYEDAWYASTDGQGHSLAIADATADPQTWNAKSAWQASDQPLGTPGYD